jgi:hypothetical protein
VEQISKGVGISHQESGFGSLEMLLIRFQHYIAVSKMREGEGRGIYIFGVGQRVCREMPDPLIPSICVAYIRAHWRKLK